MKLIKKEYEHYVNINTEVNLNNSVNFEIYIVYFINCVINNNYLDWLYNQLNLVINMGATIYIVATINSNNKNTFETIVKQFFPNVKIYCHYEDEFEYRGIHKVWELGQIHNKPTDIILYFHSKGLTHHDYYDQNKYDNYNVILQDINKIKEIFSIFPKIDKVGYSSGGNGWIWYNFWYARGSYIFSVEEPIKTTRRHYYEDWLSRKVDINDKNPNNERPLTYYQNTLNTCYGFHTNKTSIANIGSYFDPCGIYNNI